MDDLFDTSMSAEAKAAGAEAFDEWVRANLSPELEHHRDLLRPVWALAHNKGAIWGISQALKKTTC